MSLKRAIAQSRQSKKIFGCFSKFENQRGQAMFDRILSFKNKKPSIHNGEKPIADVTVVLNIWKRKYLKEQLAALHAQTMIPANIWIVHYENHVPVTKTLKHHPEINYFHSTNNLKYFGRFSIGSHINTEYTWILDDDIVPSPTWLETCLRTCDAHRAIVCCNGRIIDRNDYTPELAKTPDYLNIHFIGDARPPHPANHCLSDTLVDYGCSSFFFKTEWIKHFWSIWPATFQTGEDMHLSAACKIRAGIRTIVPRQLSIADSGNIKPEYSSDEHASWTKQGFIGQRRDVLKYLIDEQGWLPMAWEEPLAAIR